MVRGHRLIPAVREPSRVACMPGARRVLRSALLVVASSLAGCGGEPAQEVVFEPQPTPVAAPEPGPERVSIYDAQGELRESDVVVAGLRMPRGVEQKLSYERRHVFETSVPMEKVQRYFGPRLRTPIVTPNGQGVTYRDATPRDATGGVVRLDVTLVPAGLGRVQIDIYELPPPPPRPLTEAEVRAIVEREERERRLSE
jgi:hypothetical protein